MAQIADGSLHVDDQGGSLTRIGPVSPLIRPAASARCGHDIALRQSDENRVRSARHPILLRRLSRFPWHISANGIGQKNRRRLGRISVDGLPFEITLRNVDIHRLIGRIDRVGYVNSIFIGPKGGFLAIDSHHLFFIFRRIQVETVNGLDGRRRLSLCRPGHRLYLPQRLRVQCLIGGQSRPASHQKAEHRGHYLAILHPLNHLS